LPDRPRAAGRTGSCCRTEAGWRRSRCRTRANPPTGDRGSRVHAVRDLAGQALDERLDGYVALDLLGTARVDADGSVLDVAVADDEHVGNLLELRPTDTRAEGIGVRVDHLRAEPGGAEPFDQLLAVLVVTVGDRQD